MIEVTGIDLGKFARKVYELSTPSGDIHKRLSETMLGVVLKQHGERNWRRFVLDMHKVHNRQCNMTVYESADGKWYINDTWHGHTTEQFEQLLKAFSINPPQ